MITVAELREGLRKGGVCVVDVRELDEFSQGHIEGAVNIPLGKLVRDVGKGIVPQDREVVVHCRSGVRGEIAADFLEKRGFVKVKNLEGGYLAWLETPPLASKSRKTI